MRDSAWRALYAANVSPADGSSAGLLHRIRQREAVVGVIGLGYVGLPLAHAFASVGFPVRGFDTDEKKIEALNSGGQYLDHLALAMFNDLFENADFLASCSFDGLSACDVILVAVPTPLGRHQEPDLSFVEATGARIGEALRRGQLIVLESTTFPGTTRENFATSIDAAGHELESGSDFWLAYSPEREDPGRDMATSEVPKLVGGLDATATELATSIYEAAFTKVISVGSAEVAEAAKLLENVFRAVNIALANEMKVVLSELGIDVWEVIEAAATKPYGFMPFFPGPGLGGHCIPIDPFYLAWKAKEVDQQVQFIELAGLVNQRMPNYVVDRVIDTLNDHRKPVAGSRILILGLAYKAGVGDTRESPTYELIRMFEERDATVAYHDSFAPQTIVGRRHFAALDSVMLTAEEIEAADVVVVATAQPDVDWRLVAEHAKVVVDTRNVLAPFADVMRSRLVKA